MNTGQVGRWRPGDQALGLLALIVSALAFSTAGVFTRMAPVALPSLVLWRNGFGCLGLGALVLVRGPRAAFPRLRVPLRSWSIVGCSALATVCYLAAFARTSVADISVIYAAGPMLTFALAWISLGERPAGRTIAASGAAFLGVAVTVAGSVAAGNFGGDVLALLMTSALAGVGVLARGFAPPPLATAFASALLAAICVLPFALAADVDLRLTLRESLWLAAFGLVTMTVALRAYLAGAVRVPAGRAMLVSSLELPFAPLWMWLCFGDVPPPTSMAGGAMVLTAVLYDIGDRRPAAPSRGGVPE